jgi:xylulose-5-phosphate/fructose-6-phosphate phosphoketolase
MGANPHANGGLLRRNPAHAGLSARLCRDGGAPRRQPGRQYLSPWARCCATSCAQPQLPGVRPDETASNKLQAIYEASKKVWMAGFLPEDADGGELSPDGRVMEMLSEHTLEGWLEGYLLTGRYGFFATYEAFVHVIDSMFNQHAKWLAMCRTMPWRAPIGLAGTC